MGNQTKPIHSNDEDKVNNPTIENGLNELGDIIRDLRETNCKDRNPYDMVFMMVKSMKLFKLLNERKTLNLIFNYDSLMLESLASTISDYESYGFGSLQATILTSTLEEGQYDRVDTFTFSKQVHDEPHYMARLLLTNITEDECIKLSQVILHASRQTFL